MLFFIKNTIFLMFLFGAFFGKFALESCGRPCRFKSCQRHQNKRTVMQLFISFSARKDGNSDEIAKYLCKEGDKIIFFRDLNISSCKNCNYECFSDYCKYHNDGIYSLYDSFKNYEKVVLIVPMYCGNPSSLYFIFNERCQDFFIHNEAEYEDILKRLYIIGIYGNKEQTPDFIPCLEKCFNCTEYTNHVLGLERHKYNLKLQDNILDVPELKKQIDGFMKN